MKIRRARTAPEDGRRTRFRRSGAEDEVPFVDQADAWGGVVTEDRLRAPLVITYSGAIEIKWIFPLGKCEP